MKKMKVAISQRIIPHYRVPVFTELAKRKDIDLTVFYGKGLKIGTETNAAEIAGFKHVKLFTIFLILKRNGTKPLFVWHPFLFFHLLFGRFDVVIVEPSTNFFNDIFIFLYCKLFRKKFIWYEAGAVPKNERTLKRRLIDPFITLFTIKADAFITYNSFADKFLISEHNIPREKIFRAQNALDTKQIKLDIKKFKNNVEEKKKELKILNKKVVLFIGALDRRKRINNLITANYKLNKDYNLGSVCLIVGDGAAKEWIISNSTKEELNHTMFLGKHVKDAVLYILLSDVVVLPGQGGLSINNAFACGKPAIATRETVSPNTDSIFDYIEDNKNGFVAETNNIDDLTKKLYTVLNDPELYKKLCLGALEKSKKISVPNMVNGIEDAIKYTIIK